MQKGAFSEVLRYIDAGYSHNIHSGRRTIGLDCDRFQPYKVVVISIKKEDCDNFKDTNGFTNFLTFIQPRLIIRLA